MPPAQLGLCCVTLRLELGNAPLICSHELLLRILQPPPLLAPLLVDLLPLVIRVCHPSQPLRRELLVKAHVGFVQPLHRDLALALDRAFSLACQPRLELLSFALGLRDELVALQARQVACVLAMQPDSAQSNGGPGPMERGAPACASPLPSALPFS
jgi:hypothetical protein